jgi:hypothetical protein
MVSHHFEAYTYSEVKLQYLSPADYNLLALKSKFKN